jgi:hypothetical protein
MYRQLIMHSGDFHHRSQKSIPSLDPALDPTSPFYDPETSRPLAPTPMKPWPGRLLKNTEKAA